MEGKKGFTLNWVVYLILILLVIVGSILIFSNSGVGGFLKNIFPSFEDNEGDNLNEVNVPSECEFIVGKIEGGVISTQTGNKNLYVSEGFVYANALYDKKIGALTQGLLINPEYLDAETKEYKEYSGVLPSVEELRAIDSSFLVEGYLCKDEEQKIELEKGKLCRMDCYVLDGVCRNIDSGDGCEVSESSFNDVLGCRGDEVCCVREEVFGEVVNGDYKIEKFDVEFNDGIENLLEKGIIYVDYGFQGAGRIDYKLSAPDNFCSVIRSGKVIVSNEKEGSIQYIPNEGDRVLQFSVWDPEGNGRSAVSRRILVRTDDERKGGDINGIPDGYGEGIAVRDEDFKSEVGKSNVGKSLFLFDVKSSLNGVNRERDFRVDVKDGWVEIFLFERFVIGESGEKDKADWHRLDCRQWDLRTILFNNELEDSLKDTLTKYCKYN